MIVAYFYLSVNPLDKILKYSKVKKNPKNMKKLLFLLSLFLEIFSPRSNAQAWFLDDMKRLCIIVPIRTSCSEKEPVVKFIYYFSESTFAIIECDGNKKLAIQKPEDSTWLCIIPPAEFIEVKGFTSYTIKDISVTEEMVAMKMVYYHVTLVVDYSSNIENHYDYMEQSVTLVLDKDYYVTDTAYARK